jgi:hypothetical protein
MTMKLAEALLIRSDMQRKLSSLRERITSNTLVQESDQPSEDPNALLAEAEAIIERLQKIIYAINEANFTGRTSKGRTLTQALAERDTLQLRHSILKATANSAASQPDRYGTREIRWVRIVDVVALQQAADQAAQALRDLNAEIQEANWKVELTV